VILAQTANYLGVNYPLLACLCAVCTWVYITYYLGVNYPLLACLCAVCTWVYITYYLGVNYPLLACLCAVCTWVYITYYLGVNYPLLACLCAVCTWVYITYYLGVNYPLLACLCAVCMFVYDLNCDITLTSLCNYISLEKNGSLINTKMCWFWLSFVLFSEPVWIYGFLKRGSDSDWKQTD